jgi:hypothetical protein
MDLTNIGLHWDQQMDSLASGHHYNHLDTFQRTTTTASGNSSSSQTTVSDDASSVVPDWLKQRNNKSNSPLPTPSSDRTRTVVPMRDTRLSWDSPTLSTTKQSHGAEDTYSLAASSQVTSTTDASWNHTTHNDPYAMTSFASPRIRKGNNAKIPEAEEEEEEGAYELATAPADVDSHGNAPPRSVASIRRAFQKDKSPPHWATPKPSSSSSRSAASLTTSSSSSASSSVKSTTTTATKRTANNDVYGGGGALAPLTQTLRALYNSFAPLRESAPSIDPSHDSADVDTYDLAASHDLADSSDSDQQTNKHGVEVESASLALDEAQPRTLTLKSATKARARPAPGSRRLPSRSSRADSGSGGGGGRRSSFASTLEVSDDCGSIDAGYDLVGHVDDEDEVASSVAQAPPAHSALASPYVVRINNSEYEPWTAFKA